MDRTQGSIDWKMRRTLVIWLIEVHKEYKLRQETIYLAVNLLDRFCSLEPVERNKYQLLGITCIWIAAKYEENHGKVPNVRNLSFMCCDSYTEKEFTSLEKVILLAVSFDLGFVTPETFMKRLVKLNPHVFTLPETRSVARFLCELTLADAKFISFKASVIAQASLLLAHQITHSTGWKVEAEIEHCKLMLVNLIASSPAPIYNKYSNDGFCKASQIAHNWYRVQTSRYMTPSTLFGNLQLTPPKDSTDVSFWDPEKQPESLKAQAMLGLSMW